MFTEKTQKIAYPIFLTALLLLNGCAAGSFISYKINPDYPEAENQTIELSKLSEPVQVYLDEAGISHVLAGNDMDLVRAVGFVQARDRFFAMDAMRRIACGRISELVGEQRFMDSSTVDFDLTMRGWGFYRDVEKDADKVPEKQRELLQAYADGVNRALELYPPLEYRLLRVEPEPWTIRDSFAIGRLLAWSLAHNYHQELTRLILAYNVGLDRSEKIYGNDFWHGGFSLDPATEEPRELPPAIADELREMFKAKPYDSSKAPVLSSSRIAADMAKLAGASNSWAVGAEMSESGSPILASDPHLAHMLPSMFYQQHIAAPGIDAIGVTVAGLPYVLIGHNEKVAWGATTSVADAIDLYIEKPNPENSAEYLAPDGYRMFHVEQEVIRVRDGGDYEERTFDIRYSRHGVLLNDMFPKLLPDDMPPVAMRWDTSGVADSIGALSEANRAKSVIELRKTLCKISVPSQSWSAADVDGRIAHFMTGVLPIRSKHRGTFPVPGWLSEYDWTGSYDPQTLPGEITSEGEFFAHANNLTIHPQKGGEYFQIDSAPSYRVDRISEMMREKEKHNIESMRHIQRDQKSLRAQRITPRLLEDLDRAEDLPESALSARALLQGWDFETGADSAAAAIFFLTYRKSIMKALEDEVDERSFQFFLSQRYSTNVADLWFDDPEHVVWDNRASEKIEKRAEMIKAAFVEAVEELKTTQGEDLQAWHWGKLHDQYVKHIFGGKKALANTINLPKVEVGGGLDTVWKSHFDLGHPKTPFRAMAGPAFRMIVDLSDIENGLWVSDTGASGWPLSPYYGNQHELWLQAEYFPMISNWDRIRKEAKANITLQDKQDE